MNTQCDRQRGDAWGSNALRWVKWGVVLALRRVADWGGIARDDAVACSCDIE